MLGLERNSIYDILNIISYIYCVCRCSAVKFSVQTQFAGNGPGLDSCGQSKLDTWRLEELSWFCFFFFFEKGTCSEITVVEKRNNSAHM